MKVIVLVKYLSHISDDDCLICGWNKETSSLFTLCRYNCLIIFCKIQSFYSNKLLISQCLEIPHNSLACHLVQTKIGFCNCSMFTCSIYYPFLFIFFFTTLPKCLVSKAQRLKAMGWGDQDSELVNRV